MKAGGVLRDKVLMSQFLPACRQVSMDRSSLRTLRDSLWPQVGTCRKHHRWSVFVLPSNKAATSLRPDLASSWAGSFGNLEKGQELLSLARAGWVYFQMGDTWDPGALTMPREQGHKASHLYFLHLSILGAVGLKPDYEKRD